jgi:hypothetical protein
MKKRINAFVKLAVEELHEGMPMPSGGDCWHCCMFDAQPSVDLNQRGVTKRPPQDENTEHLVNHMDEGYVVPSMLVNALRERGYKDVGIYIHLGMNADTNTMGGEGARISEDSVRRDLRSYLTKRLVDTI